ncbi:MAG: ribokinase [Roseitalea sp.]|jgi:ribokinase|nr:ribokinase [Roseitalea sp.]MBO6721505.1 ribokinase [Roseitalea sp.]MBO6742062.1 ribokinase [Roseitalea sp.]
MPNVVILGVFVADTAYRADRQPKLGETILGNSFALGPGGKGSNQAVAAAMAAGDGPVDAHFITKLGEDPFAEMALDTWSRAGVKPAVSQHAESYTGAAYIFVEAATGNNAIIVAPGIAGTISPADIDARAELIASADVFITQLEQPMDAAMRALEIASAAGVTTVLNPAPAATLPDGMLALCDLVTPNESEAGALVGHPVVTVDDARRAAGLLREGGARAAIITLGEQGALYDDGTVSEHVPAFKAGPVVETTGAGDAFNGGLAVALAEGQDPVSAVRFGCATAGISVTRAGTAPSMPERAEIETLLARS